MPPKTATSIRAEETARTERGFRSPVTQSLRDGRKSQKAFVLLPPGLMKVISAGASMHGRSLSDEIRVALEIHAMRSVLAALPDPAIQARLGDTAEQYEADLQSDLRRVEADAYVRPTPEGLLVLYEPSDDSDD